MSSIIHTVDTTKNTALTIFDGSREDDSKLAKQFWNSVLLIPPVESTLVCKEIKQRTRSRTIDENSAKPRFSTTIAKTKNEKSDRDQAYDEATAFQYNVDEAKRLKASEQRQLQVRELFYKQAKANRVKNEKLIVSQLGNYLNTIHQERAAMTCPDEPDENKFDEDERQLVCSLPD